MAESFVNVTEGAGKKLHTFQKTIGANTVEDEVVLLGENYLATYLFSTPFNAAVSTATANSHGLQIMAGASLKVRVRRIEIYQTVMATAVALMQMSIFRLTSAGTGGTAIGAIPLDSTDAAAGCTGIIIPGVKGTEGAAISNGYPYMMQTLGASAQLAQPIWVWDFDRPRSKPLIIQAGVANGIAVKIVTAVAGGAIGINVWVDESNF